MFFLLLYDDQSNKNNFNMLILSLICGLKAALATVNFGQIRLQQGFFDDYKISLTYSKQINATYTYTDLPFQ